MCLSARSAVVYMLRVARCRTGCVSPLACNVRPLLRAFAESSVSVTAVPTSCLRPRPPTGNADDATESASLAPHAKRASLPNQSHTRVGAFVPMIYRIAFAIFAAIAIAGSAAEETAADPCLAEDYAEANCTHLCRQSPCEIYCITCTAHLTYSTHYCAPLQTARAVRRVATSSRDMGELAPYDSTLN